LPIVGGDALGLCVLPGSRLAGFMYYHSSVVCRRGVLFTWRPVLSPAFGETKSGQAMAMAMRYSASPKNTMQCITAYKG